MKIISIRSSSQGCCYIVESQGYQLLIECGIPFKSIQKAFDFDFKNLIACIVSHEHGDHSKYLPFLEDKTTIPIYCTQGTKDLFNLSICEIIIQNKIIKPGGNFAVLPVKLLHDVECFGFVIATGNDVLFYATDTSQLPKKIIVGLSHLMIEANHSFESIMDSDHAHAKRAFQNHLDIDSVVSFCKLHQKTLQEIHLIHLSDSHSDADKYKTMVARAVGVPVFVAEK